MKYRLTVFAYSVFILNVFGIIAVAVFLDVIPAVVCVFPCLMVWYHAESIRNRQKHHYRYLEIKRSGNK